MKEINITTRSPSETEAFGACLGSLMASGDAVFLSGPLGAGKTTFCKGVARGAGVVDEVTSPTFTLVHEYEGRILLAHMDLYRLPDEGSWEEEIGFADYLEGDYAVLVEWPKSDTQVVDALYITLEPKPLPDVDVREFHCLPTGARSLALLDEWVKKWLF